MVSRTWVVDPQDLVAPQLVTAKEINPYYITDNSRTFEERERDRHEMWIATRSNFPVYQ